MLLYRVGCADNGNGEQRERAQVQMQMRMQKYADARTAQAISRMVARSVEDELGVVRLLGRWLLGEISFGMCA